MPPSAIILLGCAACLAPPTPAAPPGAPHSTTVVGTHREVVLPTPAAPPGTPHTITVGGHGKISAAPDMADITVGVVSQASTARDALAANTEAMQALLKAVKERGVAAKDVQTSQITVSPQYSQPGGRMPGQPQAEFIPRIAGYRVTNAVRITARDLSKLGALLDAVTQAGANQVQGIAFRVDHPEKLLDEARKRAMADARRKAELLAGEAGVVLGPLIQIEEDGLVRPQPLGGGVRMAAMAAVPIAAGEHELTASVRVVYELRRAK